MTEHFDVRSGHRVVSTPDCSRREAALDHVRSLGWSRGEVMYLGTDAVAMAAAINRAAEVRPVPADNRVL